MWNESFNAWMMFRVNFACIKTKPHLQERVRFCFVK